MNIEALVLHYACSVNIERRLLGMLSGIQYYTVGCLWFGNHGDSPLRG